MSQVDDDSSAVNLKIDILLCKQHNWVIDNMYKTSKTGFYVLKEFLQKIKNSSDSLNYLEHYLNLVKDVENDLVLWKNQYDLLSNGKTFQPFQFNNHTDQRERGKSSSLDDENNFIQNYPNHHSFGELKDNYNEISSDINYFKMISTHSQSIKDITQLDTYHEDKDEDEKTLELKNKGTKTKKENIIESMLDSDRDTRIWYKCGWNGCSFGSFYNGVVKRHNQHIHNGQMKISISSESPTHRFKCDWPQCNVSLVAYHKLVEHKRIHTGEKPFKCKWSACNYATARLYSMISHEKSHH